MPAIDATAFVRDRSNAPQPAAKSRSSRWDGNAILPCMGSLHELAQSGDFRARPLPDEETGRVVLLRPRQRGSGHGGQPPASSRPPIEDIGKFERNGRDDDYRHRMVMNVLGFLTCAVLVAAGVWIANAIAELRHHQDCVISGRHDCSHIETPSRLRW